MNGRRFVRSVDNNAPPRLVLGDFEKRLSASIEFLHRGPLETIEGTIARAHPLAADLGIEIEDQRQVRHQPADCDAFDVREERRGALIGTRRIDVAVAKYVLATSKRWLDDVIHEIGPRSSEQERLRIGPERFGSAAEQNVSDCLGTCGPPRLAGHRDRRLLGT